MLHFILFFGVLMAAVCIFYILWRKTMSPVNRYLVVRNASLAPRTAWAVMLLYVIAGWAAVCIVIAHAYAPPGTAYWWAYFIVAAIGCLSPFTHPEAPFGTNAKIALVALVAFFVHPPLMSPWGWLLQYL